VERLFAWLQTYRRLLVRYEHYHENFLGTLQLGLLPHPAAVFMR
jgi:hypothetical protein